MALRHRLRLSAPFYVLNYEPLIVSAFWSDLHEHVDFARRLLPPGARVDILCQFGWEVRSDKRYTLFRDAVRDLQRSLPQAHFHFLANTQGSQEAMERDGLSAIFCSHNALVDERLVPLVRPGSPSFDALYLARLSPFKRHHLAGAVPSLCLIGNYWRGHRSYGEEVLRDLDHAHWVPSVPYSRLTEHFSRAATGLCLSQSEGAMYASVEYLLAGLPVVSTWSMGGRDVFFDPEFVAIARDSPEAVWDAVQDVRGRGVPPQAIRDATLERIRGHRARFDGLINRILSDRGGVPAFRWEEHRVHKLGLRNSVTATNVGRSNPLAIWVRTRLGQP